MALTKNDLTSIQKIVKSEVTTAKKELTKKIEVESSLVAGICKRGFDEGEKKNKLAHKELKTEIQDVRSLAQNIDRKLDAEVERHDDQDLKIENHEERIIIIEKKDKIKV